MPLYEYNCADCDTTFEKLRTMSKANDPAVCAQCGSADTSRAISLFSAISKGSNGVNRAISGSGGGCGSCTHSGGHCTTCSH